MRAGAGERLTTEGGYLDGVYVLTEIELQAVINRAKSPLLATIRRLEGAERKRRGRATPEELWAKNAQDDAVRKDADLMKQKLDTARANNRRYAQYTDLRLRYGGKPGPAWRTHMRQLELVAAADGLSTRKVAA